MVSLSDSHPLRRMFSGLAEYTFIAELGVTDTQLVDYVSGLLARFIHRDAIFAVRDGDGVAVRQLADMVAEAERESNAGGARREIYRHIGDFALFWTGVFPEALERRRQGGVALISTYLAQGKRSYHIASTYIDTPAQQEQAPVLKRLSDEFELCAYGLRKVRSQWEEKKAS